MIEVKDYDLPDFDIFDSDENFEAFVWQPDKICLILGQSNRADTSLVTEKVIADDISVYKRPSGGETVILTPNMLVISVFFRTTKLKNPKEYFYQINSAIITALETSGIKDLAQNGISDIVIKDKKILGSSIYRKPDKVFYHAVLNVSERIETISKYISHPNKEPDYRKGRTHEDFVTSIALAGYKPDYADLKQEILFEIIKNKNKLLGY